MAGEGTPIGALAVRIGADATELIDAMNKGGKAVEGMAQTVKNTVSVFKAFAGSLAVGAMVEYVKHAADLADQAGKMAQKVGMTVEAFSAMKYAAGIADVNVEQLSVGLRTLAKNMLEASNGTGDAKDAFKALGIEVSSGFGTQIRGTEETLLALADKFSKMEDGAGKTAIALKIFGRAGSDLIPFLNQGRDGIEALRKEAERLGVVISQEASKRAEEFNDNLRRLKASAEGLSIALTSDLIKGLGETTKALLQVKLEGAGFVRQLSVSLATLFGGDDMHRWNVDFVEAVENLDHAQRNLIAAKYAAQSDNGKLWPDQAAASVAKYTKAVDEAQKRVDTLKAIKKDLLGPKAEEDKPPEPPKKPAPHLQTDEERRREQEVRDAAHRARVADDEREIKQIEFQNARKEELRLSGLAAQEDINKKIALFTMNPSDPLGLDQPTRPEHDAKVVALQNFNKTAAKLEDERYRASIASLDEFSDEELAAVGGRQKAEQKLEREHWDQIQAIRGKSLSNLADFAEASWDAQSEYMLGSLVSMTQGAAREDRKMFEINKAASLALAIVKGIESVQNSFAFGSEFGGPYVGAAMAAIAAAATIANVNAIRRTQFGSSSAPSNATTPATPVTNVPGPVQSQQRTGGTTVLNLHGDRFGRDELIDLFKAMNAQNKDGSQVLVTGS